MYEFLCEKDRRTLVLALQYQMVRRDRGEFNYQVFGEITPDVVAKPTFKAFQTVAAWLDAKGWKPSVIEKHWQGYVRFVFEYLGNMTPQPGQLKNDMLFKRYMLSAPKESERSQLDMPPIYAKAIRQELQRFPVIVSTWRLDAPPSS